MSNRTGILLINLGTPRSPHWRDVYRYLIEFLTDPKVIDLPWLQRQLLVRGFIVPFRCKQSAKAYRHIWTAEGSPLLFHGKKLTKDLQATLGNNFHVELAMRYQEPSIQKGIQALLSKSIDHLIVLPLFPQYASATTGSVHHSVMETLKTYSYLPKLTLISQYYDHPLLIKAFASLAKEYELSNYDHILFSFHGLPQRQIKAADCRNKCLTKGCCEAEKEKNSHCYSAQCHFMMRSIADALGVSSENYSIAFQSRLGKDPWLQPYASDVIASLAKEGKKKVLVLSPSFVCDCLETTFEIGVEYAREFTHAGGEKLQLVGGLNDHPLWVQTLKDVILNITNGEKLC